jgi:hypothetical protein
MKSLKDIWWVVSDWIWPTLRPLSQEEIDRQNEIASNERSRCEEQIKALPDDETNVAKYLAECGALLEHEEERRRSVEARLTNFIGLSTIAGTIVVGAILALATGTLRTSGTLLRRAMAIGALYLVLQISCAILASISGLSRRNYIAQNGSDVLPLREEALIPYLHRQIKTCIAKLSEDRLRNDEKVSHMAVAHCATRNFLCGLLLFASGGTYFAWTAKNTSDDLLQRIREDHQVYELLRGPQGPKGDAGPQGPKGDPGPSQPNLTDNRRQNAPKH